MHLPEADIYRIAGHVTRRIHHPQCRVEYDDLLQIAAMAAVASMQRYDPRRDGAISLGGWAYMAALLTARNACRRAAPRLASLDAGEEAALLSYLPDPIADTIEPVAVRDDLRPYHAFLSTDCRPAERRSVLTYCLTGDFRSAGRRLGRAAAVVRADVRRVALRWRRHKCQPSYAASAACA